MWIDITSMYKKHTYICRSWGESYHRCCQVLLCSCRCHYCTPDSCFSLLSLSYSLTPLRTNCSFPPRSTYIYHACRSQKLRTDLRQPGSGSLRECVVHSPPYAQSPERHVGNWGEKHNGLPASGFPKLQRRIQPSPAQPDSRRDLITHALKRAGLVGAARLPR